MSRLTSAIVALCLACLVACGGGGGTPADSDAIGDAGPLLDSNVVFGDTARDGSTCPVADECTPGTQRCAGVDIQTCEIDASDCAVWSVPSACEPGLFCSGGGCTDTCTATTCNDGARTCASADTFAVCALQSSGCIEWGAAQACPPSQTCTGEGICMACTNGVRRCGPLGEVQTCTAGRWTLTEGCPFGCSDGACDEQVTCAAGAYRCRGNNVEACNSSGSAWLHVQTCAVSCGGNGLCNGECEAGDVRCNGASVETCNGAGTAWDVSETCSTYCSAGACALGGLDLSSNTELDGVVHIVGELRVRLNTILSSPTGDLTIYADRIVVDSGASIAVAPTGERGRGSNAWYSSSSGTYRSARGGSYDGNHNDAWVGEGAAGGDGLDTNRDVVEGTGGLGGGVLRLIANTITIDGQVTANGANGASPGRCAAGGGSGGGILIAADNLTINGSVSATGGIGGDGNCQQSGSKDGGNGHVKLLHGAMLDETEMSSVEGAVTRGLMPPLQIGSGTHPEPDRWYNDGFPVVGVSWERPFSPLQGYYWRHDTALDVPTPGFGEFVMGEIVSFPSDELREGSNLFQIISVDPTSSYGRVAGTFEIQLNRSPPGLGSSSHEYGRYTLDNDVFMAWDFPRDEDNFQGVHYVFDKFGDTIPTAADTFVPTSQKQQLLTAIDDGIWVFHVVSVDTQGYLTKEADHYQVRIGEDPGSGNVTGQVVDADTSEAVSGAFVDINRGIVPPGYASNGDYNISDVPAGTWELRVRAEGYEDATMTITVDADMPTLANVTLTPLPDDDASEE